MEALDISSWGPQFNALCIQDRAENAMRAKEGRSMAVAAYPRTALLCARRGSSCLACSLTHLLCISTGAMTVPILQIRKLMHKQNQSVLQDMQRGQVRAGSGSWQVICLWSLSSNPPAPLWAGLSHVGWALRCRWSGARQVT